MYFNIDRTNAKLHLEKLILEHSADVAMFERVLDAIKTYTRKTANGWMFKHLKEHASVVGYDDSIGTVQSFHIIDRSEGAPHRDAAMVWLEKDGATDAERFRLGVEKRLDGMRISLESYRTLLATFDTFADKFDTLARQLDTLLDTPGVYSLSDFVPRLRR